MRSPNEPKKVRQVNPAAEQSDATDPIGAGAGSGADADGAPRQGDGAPSADHAFRLKSTAELAGKLEWRATILSISAFCVVTLIIVLLGFGAYAFYFADELLVRDIADPGKELVTASSNIVHSNTKLAQANQEEIAEIKPLDTTLGNFIAATASARVSGITYDKETARIIDQLIKVRAEHDEAKKVYDQTFGAYRKEIDTIMNDGSWKTLPGRPPMVSDPQAQRRSVERFVEQAARREDIQQDQATYAVVRPAIEIFKTRDDAWLQRQRSTDRIVASIAEFKTNKTIFNEGLAAMNKLLINIVGTELPSQVAGIRSRIGEISKRTSAQIAVSKQAESSIKNALEKFANIEKEFTSFSVYTGLFTRVSILGILIFLVRILTGMYRYNLRLASHYKSRADALRLVDSGRLVDLDGLAKILTPANVDFGQAPVSPLEQVTGFAKEIVSKAPSPRGTGG